MKKIVDIYRCKKKEGAYIYLAKGSSIDELPQALLEQTGKLELAMTMLLTPEKKLARADVAKVLESLDSQGFYLQMPPAPESYMQQIANDKLTQKPI
ncbi:YcgL domain-containing protein [Agarilytica rhodophyticola]|uniref:YcgL domain-containing protein n=1 Tax=Agarilytica rhodophyticola TaxID=1737490 RepID=UPI000B341771|nr:YcgL domain-containing protein [Agarilytica rhodophyticola]